MNVVGIGAGFVLALGVWSGAIGLTSAVFVALSVATSFYWVSRQLCQSSNFRMGSLLALKAWLNPPAATSAAPAATVSTTPAAAIAAVCTICRSPTCLRDHRSPQHPLLADTHPPVLIQTDVDQKIRGFIERFVVEYIEKAWYGQISEDVNPVFLREVRCQLATLTIALVHRLKKLNIATLVSQKILPLALAHLHARVRAVKLAREKSGKLDEPLSQFSSVNVCGYMATQRQWFNGVHCGMKNAGAEQAYLRNVLEKVMELLLPNEVKESKATVVVLRELVLHKLLVNALNAASNKHFMYRQLISALEDDDEERIKRNFEKPDSERVVLLANYPDSHSDSHYIENSAFTMNLGDIMSSNPLLLHFMRFMQQLGQQNLNLLTFVLDCENLIKALPDPTQRAQSLSMAQNLGKMFFNVDALEPIELPKDILEEVRMKMTLPDFPTLDTFAAAYRHVNMRLGTEFCQLFRSSKQYYQILLAGKKFSTKPANDKPEYKRHQSVSVKQRKTLLGKVSGVASKMVSTLSMQKSNTDTPFSFVEEDDSFLPPGSRLSSSGGAKMSIVVEEPLAKPMKSASVSFGGEPTLPSSPSKPRSSESVNPILDAVMSVGRTVSRSLSIAGAAGAVTNTMETTGTSAGSQTCEDDRKLIAEMRTWQVIIPSSSLVTSTSKRFAVYRIEVSKPGIGDELMSMDTDSLQADRDSRPWLCFGEAASWEVDRRYQEFAMLHAGLRDLHGDEIGELELPSRKTFGIMDPEFIEERRCKLEGYIQLVLRHVTLHASPLLRSFLLPTDEFSVVAKPYANTGSLKERLKKFSEEVLLGPNSFEPMMMNMSEQRPALTPAMPTLSSMLPSVPEKPIVQAAVQQPPVYVPEDESEDEAENEIEEPVSIDELKLKGELGDPEEMTMKEPIDLLVYLIVEGSDCAKNRPILKPVMEMVRMLFSRTFDDFLTEKMNYTVSKQTTETELKAWVDILQSVAFDTEEEPSEAEKEAVAAKAWTMLKDFYVLKAVKPLLGTSAFESALRLIYDLLAEPKLVRHLLLSIFDVFFVELFPEIAEVKNQPN